MDYRKFGWSTGRYLKPDQLSAVYVPDPEIVPSVWDRSKAAFWPCASCVFATMMTWLWLAWDCTPLVKAICRLLTAV